MKYSETKSHLIDEICELCQNLDTDTLAGIMEMAIQKQPIHLDDYIAKEFSEYHEEIRKELSHEIRKIWLKTSPGCTEPGYLMRTEEDVAAWHDIEIGGLMLDTWVAEQGTLFNPIEIAMIIFDIYCGKINFRK